MLSLYVDLKGAFDMVDRDKLWENMRRRGMEEKLIRKIKELYRRTRVRMRIGEEMSEEFWVEKGVRQGCPPTAFQHANSGHGGRDE